MPPRVLDDTKYCDACGKIMERKRYGSKPDFDGRLEGSSQFANRKYCDSFCANNRNVIVNERDE